MNSDWKSFSDTFTDPNYTLPMKYSLLARLLT
jgi:hypothetical protein